LTRAAEQESADGGTAAVGRLTLDGTVVPVAPRGPAQVEFDLDNAVQAGLARTSEHTLVTATGSPPSYRVEAFGPPTSLPAPVVATFDGGLGVQVILLNGGERVLVASERGPIRTRWVDIPGLRSFYHLPPADALRLRTLWADRLASVDPAANRTAALAIPRLRAVLARYGAAAFPVRVVRRGTPSRDRGGIVNGITLPVPGQPVREPRCYLPVIAEVEGRLESVNAWDAGAGISLGPIQFNVDRGALFDFLWRLWTKDPDLFATALTGPLSWTMARHGDHPDLLVARAGRTDTLHGRVADRMTNAAYLQSGQLGSTGFTPGYRRNVAAALRDCVVWPHVQEMVLDVSAEWLEPALADIHAEGIGPLDPAAPDLDTFVLTALLLSARVRYSGCLRPILDELRRWSGAGEKLAHWKDAVKAARSPCPDLETRLGMQDGHARHVYGQLVLPALTAPAAQSAAEATETVDPASAAGVPAAPRTAMVPGLSAKRSAAAQAWNAAQHPAVSGVPGAGVVAAVATHVSLAAATGAAHAAGAPVGTAPFDATAVEAVHQFQAGAFAEAGQRDGKAGPSTLDSLGLVRRTGPNPVAAVNAVGQKRLDAASAEVVARTGGEFTASTWWEGMVNPGWLGLRFRNGIHLELARRLRRAEALLLAQPAYAGMTGVQLGHALGVGEEHKGARPRAATASMHTFGLAVDVAYTTNPWIVGQHVDGGATPSPAGAVTVAANTALTQALNRAALLVHGERVDITAAHLSRLAKGTTAAAWDDLQRRHTALCQYLAAAGDVPAAAALVHANSAVAGVVEPGENIAAAGRRWARSAATDLAE
ncbi:MAG TPA: hypothetical protein VHK88_12730, partial [Aquihabitans sp.]|nr:hypothetical protein [Aquihabitans sp.]